LAAKGIGLNLPENDSKYAGIMGRDLPNNNTLAVEVGSYNGVYDCYRFAVFNDSYDDIAALWEETICCTPSFTEAEIRTLEVQLMKQLVEIGVLDVSQEALDTIFAQISDVLGVK